MSSERFSRRDLLKASGPGLLALWLTLNGCSPGEKRDNSHLLEFLKNQLQITPFTTQTEFAQTAYLRAKDQTWFKDEPIGTFRNKRGESVDLATDSLGELVLFIPEPSPIQYPSVNGLDAADYVFLSEGQENHLIVYGTNATVQRSGEYGFENIANFLSQYFSGSKSPVNRVHLDFSPVVTGGGFSVFLPSHEDSVTGKISYPFLDISLRMNRAHFYAEWLGMSLEDMLRFGFANEAVGFLGGQVPDSAEDLMRTRSNEAFSTLAALASALDRPVSNLTLGGDSHFDLIPQIALEMERLA